MIPVILVFSIYIWTQQSGFVQADIYPLLAISTLLTYPVANLVHTWTKTRSILTSYYRIQDYLLQTEFVDIRKTSAQLKSLTPPPRISNATNDSSSSYIVHNSILVENCVAGMTRLGTVPVTEGKQVLHDAEAYFPREQLTIITGPVASGKTTLIRVLLGEVATTEGRVYIDKNRIGYCGQQIWLRNESVKQNIIWPNAMSEGWYNTVTRVCCLHTDFQLWPHGDNTLAGHMGNRLSQGQRQRIVSNICLHVSTILSHHRIRHWPGRSIARSPFCSWMTYSVV